MECRGWLLDRWREPVYLFCRRLLNHEEDAYDAAHDTLFKVLRNLHRYDPERSFKAWVFGIARNTCIDEHRRRKRRGFNESREIADTATPSPLQNAARVQRAAILERALQEVPPMYREVLILFHFEHLKYTEIADVLGIPLGTVMNRIFRARKKLRASYEALGGDQP